MHSDCRKVCENFTTLASVSSQCGNVVENVLPSASFASPCENSADIECTLNNAEVLFESSRSGKCIAPILSWSVDW